MPKCRNCDREITIEDRDICPFCGTENPIPHDYRTSDITQIIPKQEHFVMPNSRSRKITALLFFLLGFTGAPFFYILKKKNALISIMISVILLAGIGTGFFFLFGMAWWGYLIAFAIDLVAFWPLGVRYLINDTLKTGEGEFLH